MTPPCPSLLICTSLSFSCSSDNASAVGKANIFVFITDVIGFLSFGDGALFKCRTIGANTWCKECTEVGWYLFHPDRVRALRTESNPALVVDGKISKVHFLLGIGLLTPEQVHYCLGKEVTLKRANDLKAAFRKHPSRFKGKVPQPLPAPREVWISPPKDLSLAEKTK